MKRKTKKRIIAVAIPFLVLLVLSVSFFVYTSDYYHADETALKAADVDDDGIITENDSKVIQKYLAGIIKTLPVKYGDVNDLCDKIQEWFRVNGELRDYVRQSCYQEIDSQWTPDFQLNVLHSVLDK